MAAENLTRVSPTAVQLAARWPYAAPSYFCATRDDILPFS
jgi:hypothetical protein